MYLACSKLDHFGWRTQPKDVPSGGKIHVCGDGKQYTGPPVVTGLGTAKTSSLAFSRYSLLCKPPWRRTRHPGLLSPILAMVGVVSGSLYRRTHSLSRLAWSSVGGRLAPFYIHQMNRVNSRNVAFTYIVAISHLLLLL